ncbi:MAG TPA: cytochrome c [Acidisarcina sp.]|nr:cytochrome c [Acidisarcina sp.]
MKTFLLGLLLGVLCVPLGALVYFQAGTPPVAVSDKPFPMEETLVHIPMHARIRREAAKAVPMEASATNLEAGAHIYRQQCSACHGLYGRPSAFASHMYPVAPQLWQPHGNGVVGVSDDPPSETYWKVANGIRLTGMPSYSKVLNQTEMWQVSLLLANADKPMPPGVLELLKRPFDYDPPATGADAAVLPTSPAK